MTARRVQILIIIRVLGGVGTARRIDDTAKASPAAMDSAAAYPPVGCGRRIEVMIRRLSQSVSKLFSKM